ncbi:MAG: DUF1385 domain-containing protein [Eubacteriales bacterium]|nr:DUF1385 domain-containing protein [Eubacteriales bacterium]
MKGIDFSKIFLKDACPTSIGGQALIEGVMMRGPDRTAAALRAPDGRLYLKTIKNRKAGKISKLPLIRGVVSFFGSLVSGMKILTFSADAQEALGADSPGEEEPEEETWLEKKIGKEKAWDAAVLLSVVIAVIFTLVGFVLLPTALVGFLRRFIGSHIVLNLLEGVLRLALFLGYIGVISKMEDIQRVFEYHGAEHKTIHCFENGLDLTPENARNFYRLHPRCGTSFLMFVMVVSLLVFSLLGWPNLLVRVLSRVLLMPVVAGLSYELLRWAGRSDNKFVVALSIPGLLLQKMTTREPDVSELETAICAMKAVLVPEDAPLVEGYCDKNGNIVEEWRIDFNEHESEGASRAGREAASEMRNSGCGE